MSKSRVVSVWLTFKLVDKIKEIVKDGYFLGVSDFIRFCINFTVQTLKIQKLEISQETLQPKP